MYRCNRKIEYIQFRKTKFQCICKSKLAKNLGRHHTSNWLTLFYIKQKAITKPLVDKLASKLVDIILY